jgi:alkylhydroperoxidase family enzyme
LRQAGFSEKAILEAGEIAAQFSLFNRLSKAFGWKVGPEYDQPFR